ncbi:MAG: cofactor-independent phosphoglycerate mutase, partial [Kiritimatiellia bacterium]|nr:cofactor-independent phosphoglycerate mutase [Kiritimatiellia bacterium]
MKIAILVGDGMGDYGLPEYGGRTPLQEARIPTIRRIAAAGHARNVLTVPAELSPGSDVANLALLGYDPRERYTGRAPIEAAGADLELGPEDTAFRCNLVTISDGRMADYSAGHITTEDAREIIETLDRELGGDGLRFHPGVSYRHLLIWRNGPVNLRASPPHDITGRPAAENRPTGDRENEVRRLMEASIEILRDHPVTRRRRERGEIPASQIWLWGQGRAMQLPSFQELYGLRGGVVSAVDLVRGLGRLAGLEAPKIPGATGFLDTDTGAKVRAACDILRRGDFVYVHFEAPDECGHLGDAKLKIEAIEMFDVKVVEPMWAFLESLGEPYRLIVATDHRTPCATRGHTGEPVPLAVLKGPLRNPAKAEAPFDETLEPKSDPPMAFDQIRKLLER